MSAVEIMQFDEIMAAAAERQEVVVPDSWAQGRTVYGGLSAGLLCEAASKGVDSDRRLRSLKVNFLRPLETEKPFRVEVEEISAGRTVVVRSAQIIQDGAAHVIAQASFVTRLDSQVHIETFRPPTLKPWNAEGALRMRGPGFPAFTRFIDFHTTTKGLPFQGVEVPEIGGWMRFETAPETITKSHLVCLIDAWPPAAVPCFGQLVPLSTINWGIHFAEPLDGVRGDDFLGYLARVNFFKDGYGSSTADIWAPDGRLLAKSYQTFVIYG
ncbi:MAG: thioesterase family protein [Xanthomonadales bacterium]|nr:thioesterase family protein [Xanthomonadales bacterium]